MDAQAQARKDEIRSLSYFENSELSSLASSNASLGSMPTLSAGSSTASLVLPAFDSTQSYQPQHHVETMFSCPAASDGMSIEMPSPQFQVPVSKKPQAFDFKKACSSTISAFYDCYQELVLKTTNFLTSQDFVVKSAQYANNIFETVKDYSVAVIVRIHHSFQGDIIENLVDQYMDEV